jgi:hypothetical protein
MCLDDVNEPIMNHYKINSQKNNEIQKRLNKLTTKQKQTQSCFNVS